MTICIGAISENKVVAVTDKMLTLDQPITTTFEVTDSNKVFQLKEKVMALFAGNVIHANEILNKTLEILETRQQSNEDVFKIAKIIKNAYEKHWKNVLTNHLKIRYTVTLEQFMQSQNAFDEELIKRINQIVNTFSINVQIIIAGIDNNGKPRLYTIDNNATVLEHTSLNYACIGSGAQHATLSLIESNYSRNFVLEESIFTLVQAKKRAEFDPGVGELCDIAYIGQEYKKLAESKVEKIVRHYKKAEGEVAELKKDYYDKIKSVIS